MWRWQTRISNEHDTKWQRANETVVRTAHGRARTSTDGKSIPERWPVTKNPEIRPSWLSAVHHWEWFCYSLVYQSFTSLPRKLSKNFHQRKHNSVYGIRIMIHISSTEVNHFFPVRKKLLIFFIEICQQLFELLCTHTQTNKSNATSRTTSLAHVINHMLSFSFSLLY